MGYPSTRRTGDVSCSRDLWSAAHTAAGYRHWRRSLRLCQSAQQGRLRKLGQDHPAGDRGSGPGGPEASPHGRALIRAFVEEFPTEGNRQQAARQTESPIKRQRLEATARKIAGIVTAIADGNYRKNLTERLDELEGGKARLEAELEIAEPLVLRLHPKLADIYAEKAAKLEAAPNAPSIKTETSENLRRLIDKIELAPRPEGNGLDARLYGDLAQILMFCDAGEHKRKLPEKPVPGSQLSVVAGTRKQRESLILPVRL